MNQSDIIDDAILTLATARGADKTICPSEVARYIGGQEEAAWRPLMTAIRERAVKLARTGSVEIRKGGASADPDDFIGIYRIAIVTDPSGQ